MAGGSNPTVIRSYKGDADLSAKKYYIVEKNADGTVGLAEAASDILKGVIDDGGKASGDMIAVITQGIAKILLGGTVNEGDSITADSAGKGVATTTEGDNVIGRAEEAGVSGDIISVDLNQNMVNYYAG